MNPKAILATLFVLGSSAAAFADTGASTSANMAGTSRFIASPRSGRVGQKAAHRRAATGL